MPYAPAARKEQCEPPKFANRVRFPSVARLKFDRLTIRCYNKSMKKHTRPEQEIRNAVKNSRSKRQALIALGVAAQGGNYRVIDGWVKRYNIDTSHWLGQRWQSESFGPRLTLDDILVEGRHTNSSSLRLRLLKEKVFEAICVGCGLDKWLGDPIPLELDHVNGVHDDNRIENLRLLCPNCHALTPTYRGKNKKPA